MNELMIIGASGQGKVIADIAEKLGYTNIRFLDDNPQTRFCGAYEVVGGSGEAAAYRGADFIVAIGNGLARQRIQNELVQNELSVATLIHPNAVVAKDVQIGAGTVVMAGAVINPGARIGQGCIINTCASVDHDCRIGDYVHISVGAHVAGTVTVGNNTWIGIGACISNNLEITAGCMIGAGAVVVRNIQQAGTYVGVPAQKRG